MYVKEEPFICQQDHLYIHNVPDTKEVPHYHQTEEHVEDWRCGAILLADPI